MANNSEIKALLQLMDDPDEEVFSTVSERIYSLGPAVIPALENYWQTIESTEVQDRIELLIHKLHFNDLQVELKQWAANPTSLAEGAIIIAKYKYPDLEAEKIKGDIEKIRRNIWLELNNYLTPLEQINVMNSILFNYYKFKSVEMNYASDDNFFINKALETHKGNSLSLGILYVALCQQLDLPVKMIQLPRQFILAYFDEGFFAFPPAAGNFEKIKFYLEPSSGQLYSHRDVEAYLRKLNETSKEKFYQPLGNKKVIQLLISELCKCYDNQQDYYKIGELKALSELVSG